MRDEGIIIEEVTEAIHMSKRGIAAGRDNITAEMFQNMGENGLEILTGLFNKIWKEERMEMESIPKRKAAAIRAETRRSDFVT